MNTKELVNQIGLYEAGEPVSEDFTSMLEKIPEGQESVIIAQIKGMCEEYLKKEKHHNRFR